jgi:glutathione S-transferase
LNNNLIEIWGFFTYISFIINWILEEFKLSYKVHRIMSRTGETQTKKYLSMNPKGKIPLLKYNDVTISESVAAMNFIKNNFKKPKSFYDPQDSFNKTKIDEWIYFCLMELDCLSIYTIRKHEKEENNGLSKIYGQATKAVDAARKHFDLMIIASENNVPENDFLLGNKLSCADIVFMSCLQVAVFFNLEIKSRRVSDYYKRIKNRQGYKKAMISTYGDKLN